MFSLPQNSLHLLTVLLPFFTFPRLSRAADPIPFVLQFEGDFGPDGPWHGIPALVGENRQSVHLYPAVQAFASVVFSTKVCDGWSGPGDCPAKAGGLYDESGSTDLGGIQWQANDDTILNDIFLDQTVLNAKARGEHKGISMRLGGSSVNSNTIGNSSFIRVDQVNQTLPSGKSFPLTLGFLSLGAPDDAQVFTLSADTAIVLPIPLNYLSVQHDIPSTSWSMHIGAAKLGQSGSMVWGGFDKSRVAGPVATYDQNGDSGNFQRFQLNDIWIGVGVGTNPLGYKNGNKTGLLVTNETTSGDTKTIDVGIHSEAPYLYLPKATCDKIAAELPVTFNKDFGLYIWNTNSEVYKNLINSPAYLGFSFDYNTADGSQIKVPFSLLALDLREPITSDNLTYFPCRPHEPLDKNSGVYILGRAFLQAAFIGQSWRAGKYWLAQAPGPGQGTTSTVTINNDTVTLNVNPSKDAWLNSWSSTWKVNDTVIPGGTTPTAVPADANKSGGSSSGLPTGAKAGIGAGVVVLVLAAALIAFFFYSRKKKQQRQKANFQNDMPTPTGPPTSGYAASTAYAGSYHPSHASGYNQYQSVHPQSPHQQYSQPQPQQQYFEAEGRPVNSMVSSSGPYPELEGTTVTKPGAT